MYNETKIVNAAPSAKSSDKIARIVARVCVYVALIIYAIFVVAPFVKRQFLVSILLLF